MEYANSFFELGGELLYSLNPSISREYDPTATSNAASWYSPPREVFEDMCIAITLFPWIFQFATQQNWTILWPQRPKSAFMFGKDIIAHFSQPSTSKFTTIEAVLAAADYLQRALLVVFYVITVVYKIPGRLAFMLMPCHIHAKSLLYLIFTDAYNMKNNKIHFVALCLNWGTWLAMGAPDTSDLVQFFERETFWIYHILLLTLPITWLLRRRYHIFGGVYGLLTTWCTFCLIAIFPVQILSVVLSKNITYMMVPPKPLKAVGLHYRRVFGLLCVPLLVLFTRFVFTEVFLVLGRVRQQVLREKELQAEQQATTKHNGELHISNTESKKAIAAKAARQYEDNGEVTDSPKVEPVSSARRRSTRNNMQ